LDLEKGDIVITLPKVEKIQAIIGELGAGMIGIVVDRSAKFNHIRVYGVAIEGQIYYLFEDEIKKLEEEC
tara:strand:- start:10 stop:219 length:210 start_codon:yes stop_codon:yes gene_type:complete